MLVLGPNLRKEGEKIAYTPAMVEEWKRCRDDIIYFAEKYCYVNNVDDGAIIVKLRDYQKELLTAYTVDEDPERRNRIVLSSRQSGKTETSSIFMLHYILFNRDKRVAILANDSSLSKQIVENIKWKYEKLPKFLQQGIKTVGGWSSGRIALDNNCEMRSGVTKPKAMRGFTANVLFLDEFALLDHTIEQAFMRSVMPIISSGKKTRIIISSTPNGLNSFYNLWTDAVAGRNNFVPIKIDWTKVPGRDEKFKQQMISMLGMIGWRQEYECAFLGSSKLLVTPEAITKNGQPKQPIKELYGGKLKIYEEYRPGCSYVIAADPAVGNGGDNSAIQVLRIDGKEKVAQVATYKDNNTPYDRFSAIVIEVAKMYGNPPMMVENNGVGQAVVNKLYYDYEYENMVHTAKKGIGVQTNRQVKLDACLLFQQYFENGWITLVDEDTIKELTMFEEVRDKIFRAISGAHDDLVMAVLLGLYYLSTPYFDEGSVSNPAMLGDGSAETGTFAGAEMEYGWHTTSEDFHRLW